MKTKEEVYENLYKKAVFESKKRRATKETLIIIVFLFFLSFFVIAFFENANPLIIYFFTFPYVLIGFFLIERGRSITNISKKKIERQLKIVFDEEIKSAKESNFSCEEKIKELEEMRAGL